MHFISPYSIMLSTFKSFVAVIIVYIIVEFVTLLYSEYEWNLINNIIIGLNKSRTIAVVINYFLF